MNFIRTAAKKIGMDGAIAYSSAARIFQAFSGVISIFFIATFLTGEEQGFYFTFGSILAIQVFFELGFTGIMTQYVAHEAAHLTLGSDLKYSGEEKYRSRLTYLIKFCIKWYAVISVLFFIGIQIVGVFYFNKFDRTDGEVSWKIPWLILSVSTAIKLFQSPFTAIYTGLGKVKEMNRIGFYQQIIIPVSQWVMFACGLKLYVVGIASSLGVIIWLVFVFQSDLWKLFFNLLKEKVTEKVSYMKEIFPYQWKIALSWISGYFIFQLFNPVLFATEGAVVAGKMGMTLSVLNAIQAFALSWQNTKVPVYSGYIEMKEYGKLDTLFNKTTKQMTFVCLSLLFVMFCGIKFLDITQFSLRGQVLADRFLSFIPMLLMSVTVVLNILTASWATYLRCHLREPFLVQAVVMGILCLCSTLFLGNHFGLYGVVLGYCGLTLLMGFPWSIWIFIRNKKEWHNE